MNARNRFRLFCQIGALALAVAIFGCSDDDESPTEPEEQPDFPRITETFTGMFGLGERMEHSFTTENPGDVEMRISNDPSFEGAAWEPLAFEKPWVLAGKGPIAWVYAQFRDGAGNKSLVISDDILMDLRFSYLPFIIG